MLSFDFISGQCLIYRRTVRSLGSTTHWDSTSQTWPSYDAFQRGVTYDSGLPPVMMELSSADPIVAEMHQAVTIIISLFVYYYIIHDISYIIVLDLLYHIFS